MHVSKASDEGRAMGVVLLVHVLIEHVDAAVEPEQVVQLRHEVACHGPAGCCQLPESSANWGRVGTDDCGRPLGFQP